MPAKLLPSLLALAPVLVAQQPQPERRTSRLPAQVVDRALREGLDSSAAQRVVAAGLHSMEILVLRPRAIGADGDIERTRTALALLRRIGASAADAAIRLIESRHLLPAALVSDLVATVGAIGPFANFDGPDHREGSVHQLFGFVAVDFAERFETNSPEYLAAMAAVFRAREAAARRLTALGLEHGRSRYRRP